MIPITIDEYLNKDNPWTSRLSGETDFHKKRDTLQIENEYNLDKYGKLILFDFLTIEEYKSKEFEQAGLHPITGEIIISLEDDIYRASIPKAREIYYNLITATIKKYKSENTCELGCGYGYNLSYLGKNSYGGDYCKNAVAIAKRLGCDVVEFNYYNEKDYDFIKPNSTIFTTHSIEQIPDASVIIDNLEKQKDKINYVVHFEPTVVAERTTPLGLLRNKYIEINDYNRNLIEVLKNKASVEIIELRTDIFGLVPLNTTNLIVWRFKK